MALVIRPVAPAEQRALFEAIWTAFGEELLPDTMERDMRVFEPERLLAVVDGERIVGGGALISFQLTVPGGVAVAAAGVSAVGIMPTHRRQGGLRALMLRMLADTRAAGEPLAILWASEGGIYGRFGYGLASLAGWLELERDRAVFRAPAEWAGSVRLVDAAEAAQTFPPVHDELARTTPGFWARTPAWWEAQILADPEQWRRGASRKFYLLNERAGRPVGYATYRIKADWGDSGPKGTLSVIESLGIDAEATRDVWRYLIGVDLIAKITAGPVQPDHPLLLMLAEPRRVGLRLGDGLWLRIVDVPAALSGRRYRGDGEIVLEVDDEVMPEVGGRWRLVARAGQAEVVRTDQPAQLRLDVTDLGAAYLGAFTFDTLARAGRATELADGALQRADRLFGVDRPPWSPHIF
jgi:predicted acetyltransferase